MKHATMADQLGFDFEAEVQSMPIATPALLQTLHEWSEAGWLRRLDSALAAFIATLCPTAPAAVLLATAFLSNLESQGYSCLALDDLVGTEGASMEWPEEAALALAEVMRGLPPRVTAWTDALQACSAVGSGGRADEANPEGKPPLVLAGKLLYLRRYWGYEATVARHVVARVGSFDAVDPARMKHWLDRLFAPSPELIRAPASTAPGRSLAAPRSTGPCRRVRRS